MKVNELLGEFHIFLSNEERKILESITDEISLESFNEREQQVIQGMIRKSVVKRHRTADGYTVSKNEKI